MSGAVACRAARESSIAVRVAVATGASLVPILGYGENEIFRQISNPPGSKFRILGRKSEKVVTFLKKVFQVGEPRKLAQALP